MSRFGIFAQMDTSKHCYAFLLRFTRFLLKRPGVTESNKKKVCLENG